MAKLSTEELLDAFKELTLLELSEFVKKFEETFEVTAAAPVAAAGPAADNVFFTFAPDPRKNASAAAVVKKFRDAKVEPEGYVMYAYAAMQLFADAANALQAAVTPA